MPAFDLRPAPATKPVTGLIAFGDQVAELCNKLSNRSGLMAAKGEDWLAVFSNHPEANLPWLPKPPVYLYSLAPGLMCETGFEPDIPAPLFPALIQKLAPKGTAAITVGPKLWNLSAATPVSASNLGALT